MFVQVGAFVLLAACAWASPGHIDFVVDQALAGAGVDVLQLPDISFDVDNQHNWTFSGYVEFHLQNGTLGNLRRRVRRVGDCGLRGDLRGDQDACSPLVEIWCNLNLRGVVARYNVEMIVDDKTSSMVAELLVDTGNVYFKFESHQDNCTESSHFTDFQVTEVSARLKPLDSALDHAPDVIRQFENEVVARAPKHISYAFTSAYKRALGRMIATLRASDFTN